MSIVAAKKLDLLIRYSDALATDEKVWQVATNQTILETLLQKELRKLCYLIEEGNVEEIQLALKIKTKDKTT